MRSGSLFASLMLIMACSSSTLDTIFDPSLYKGYYLKMLKEKEIPTQDIFLLNYAILRQRDYYNYEVEGKTFGEILAQAKVFQEEGLPIKEEFEESETSDVISVTTSNDGFGLLQIDKSSYQKKMFRFNAKIKNNTAEAIAMEHATFLFHGPFKDHLSTAAFEINCFLPANGIVELGFMMDARSIYSNLVFDANYEVERVDIDNVLYNLNISLGGIELNTNAERAINYDLCKKTATRRAPYQVFSYEDDLAEDWIVNGEDGKVSLLKLGKAHLDPPQKEEFIKYR